MPRLMNCGSDLKSFCFIHVILLEDR